MSRKQVEKVYSVRMGIRVVINVPENASHHQIAAALDKQLTDTMTAHGFYKFATDAELPIEYEKVKVE